MIEVVRGGVELSAVAWRESRHWLVLSVPLMVARAAAMPLAAPALAALTDVAIAGDTRDAATAAVPPLLLGRRAEPIVNAARERAAPPQKITPPAHPIARPDEVLLAPTSDPRTGPAGRTGRPDVFRRRRCRHPRGRPGPGCPSEEVRHRRQPAGSDWAVKAHVGSTGSGKTSLRDALPAPEEFAATILDDLRGDLRELLATDPDLAGVTQAELSAWVAEGIETAFTEIAEQGWEKP
ncbi:hypothetical protein ACFV4N_24060 [Actinosynnema sp. NPDC059797]